MGTSSVTDLRCVVLCFTPITKPHPQYFFFTARERSEENLLPPGVTKENLEFTSPPHSLD